jgi:hypothetical protein
MREGENRAPARAAIDRMRVAGFDVIAHHLR